MHIDRIDLFHVVMPLISPWRTAYGEDVAAHTLLCRLTSGSVFAWGESCPLTAPCYSPEWGGGIFTVARDWLAPALIGKDLSTGEELQQHLAIYKGNPFAKAALDTAWWALQSRLSGIGLHRLLGATRDHVAVGADFGVMDSLDDLVAAVGSAVDARFPRVKLKFRPGWDVEMLHAIRRNFPAQVIHIDCNSGYRLVDLPLFQRLDAFQLAMIEQPLQHDDLIDHAALQAQIGTPVCLDESMVTPRHAEQAIQLGSCRYVNIKPGRVGGLTNAVKIHDICQRAGIPCWVGGMLESHVGAHLCVALAMLDNFTYPADIFPSSRFYRQDLCNPPLELTPLSDGTPGVRAATDLPEPDPRLLAAWTVQEASFVS